MYSCQTNKKTYTCVIPTSYKEIRKTRRSKPLLINCIRDDLNIADNRHLAAFGILNALFPFIHNALHCNVALSEYLYLTKVEINLYIYNFSFVSCLSPVHFSYFVMSVRDPYHYAFNNNVGFIFTVIKLIIIIVHWHNIINCFHDFSIVAILIV